MSAKKIGLKADEARLGYWMVLPSVIIIAVFALYPIIDAIWLSLHEYKLNMPALGKNFVGLQNYITAFKEVRFFGLYGIPPISHSFLFFLNWC